VSGASALARPRHLSPGRKLALAAEILLGYARVRRAFRRGSLPAVAAAMRGSADRPRMTPESAYVSGLRLGGAVTRVLRALPSDPRCLTASLVLTALLARRGIPATLVIAVRPDPFAAHAWVEHRGKPLLPPAPAPFERLLEV
jgi:Transglutaminase-like superfamily